MDNLRSERNLYLFEGSKNQATQLSIKNVQIKYLFERDRTGEWMIRVGVFLKRVGIGSQAVVADTGETTSRKDLITKGQPPGFEFVDLRGDGFRRLVIIHWPSSNSVMKANESENLPGCAVRMGSVAGIICFNVTNIFKFVNSFLPSFILKKPEYKALTVIILNNYDSLRHSFTQ
jgi:hypothetical protein